MKKITIFLLFIFVTRFKYRRSHVAYISKLATNPDSQVIGIGTKLLTEIISILKGEDIKRIELIVELDNSKAIKFYKKLGFQIEGTYDYDKLLFFFQRIYECGK